MKALRAFVVVHLLAAVSMAGLLEASDKTVVSDSSGDTVVVQYFFEGVDLVTLPDSAGGVHTKVLMESSKPYAKYGCPLLPMTVARILLPATAKKCDVSVTAGRPETIFLDHPIEVVKNAQGSGNPPAYPFPGRFFETGEVQEFRGYRILILPLMPVQMKGEKEITLYHELKVTVTTTAKGDVSAMLRGLSKDEDRLVKMVDNPDQGLLASYCSGPASSKWVNSNGGIPLPVDMLILVPDMLIKNKFLLLRNRHQSEGIRTSFRIIKANERDWETIREIIIKFYHNCGTEYVLLAGIWAELPGHQVFVHGMNRYVATDQCFACLDGNYPDDYWAEVYVGRAPVANQDEAERFVNKTLAYMDHAVNNHLRKVLMVGEQVEGGYGKSWMERLRIYYPGSFVISTLYEADQVWTANILLDLLNTGYCFHMVNHFAHGTHGVIMKLTRGHLSQLTNGTNNRYFFTYTQACFAGDYHITNSWVERLVGEIDDGAFAAVANSNEGKFMPYNIDLSPSQIYHAEFLSYLFDSGGSESPPLGETNQISKTFGYSYHFSHPKPEQVEMCYFQTNLFGDPAVTVHMP